MRVGCMCEGVAAGRCFHSNTHPTSAVLPSFVVKEEKEERKKRESRKRKNEKNEKKKKMKNQTHNPRRAIF